MTEKQKRFADEYLIDLNGTRAYKTAYPDVKSDEAARVNSSKMLTKANIRAYIDERLEAAKSAKTAEATEMLEYLTSVMRGEAYAEVIVTEFVGDGVSKARRIEKLPDEKERLKAAELLGKRYGLFTDKVEVKDKSVGCLNDILAQLSGGDKP